jgi:hypothetical protein
MLAQHKYQHYVRVNHSPTTSGNTIGPWCDGGRVNASSGRRMCHMRHHAHQAVHMQGVLGRCSRLCILPVLDGMRACMVRVLMQPRAA